MKNIKKITLGGIISGLSLVTLLATIAFPFLDYSAVAIAGALLVSLVIEFNKKTAFMAYIAVSILSIFLVPNKEIPILYIGFFGFYPILKSIFEVKCKKYVGIILKFVTFNICIVASYFIMIVFLKMEDLIEQFGGSALFLTLFLLAGNVVFFLYDIALTKVVFIYLNKIKPKLKIN